MNIDQLSTGDLFLKRRSMRRQLSTAGSLQPIRIAVLGGSTTNEVVDMAEIFLLVGGFQPTFWQSEYGRFYEDAVLDPAELIAFAPDIVYIHTSCLNVQQRPPVDSSMADMQGYVDAELGCPPTT